MPNLLQSFGRPSIILLPLDLITPDGFTAGAIALTRCDLTFAWTVLDLFSGLALGAIDDGQVQSFHHPQPRDIPNA